MEQWEDGNSLICWNFKDRNTVLHLYSNIWNQLDKSDKNNFELENSWMSLQQDGTVHHLSGEIFALYLGVWGLNPGLPWVGVPSLPCICFVALYLTAKWLNVNVSGVRGCWKRRSSKNRLGGNFFISLMFPADVSSKTIFSVCHETNQLLQLPVQVKYSLK